MLKAFIICVLLLGSAGCADLRQHLWAQVHTAVRREVDSQFDDADADQNGELSKPEVEDLVDRALEPVKKIIVGDDDS